MKTSLNISYLHKATLVLVGLAAVVFFTPIASAQVSTSTVFLQMSKLISPEQFPGTLTASEFSFHISGNGVNKDVAHGETVELGVGTYSVTESGPASFDPGMWTVLWAGDLCNNANLPATVNGTITVIETDLVKFSVPGNPARCNAENQYKPVRATVNKQIVGTTSAAFSDFSFKVNGGSAVSFEADGGNTIDLPAGNYSITETPAIGYNVSYSAGCSGEAVNDESVSCTITNTWNGGGSGTATSTLRVVKVVVGTTTAPSNFSFSVNGGSSVAFEADGQNDLSVAAGTYSIVETGTTTGYTVSYNNCNNLVLNVETTATCIITNTLSNGGGGGEDEYRIEGYVWHDADQNGVWPDTENPLEGWVVTITNGTTTATTTTNSAGYYSFVVGAGTWTISETLQPNWSQSFPSSPNTYTVTVPQNEEVVNLWFPFNLFFKVAHAAVVQTYSGFNFGNFFGGNGSCCGGGGGDDDNGGGGGGDDDNGGGGSGGGGGSPQILGEQVSLVPGLAPAAGLGGSASPLNMALGWMWSALAWLGF